MMLSFLSFAYNVLIIIHLLHFIAEINGDMMGNVVSIGTRRAIIAKVLIDGSEVMLRVVLMGQVVIMTTTNPQQSHQADVSYNLMDIRDCHC